MGPNSVRAKHDLSPIGVAVTKVLEIRKKANPKIRTCNDVDETIGGEAEDWIARGLIAKNDINIWYAPPGVGKSHLVWFVGNSVNDGNECLEIEILQAPVTYLDLENTEDVRRHIKRLLSAGEMGLITLKDDVEIPNIDSSPEEFEKFILTLPKGVVVIDTFPMITVQTKFAESKWEVGPMFKTLRLLCDKHGYTFVLIFHSVKADPKTIKAPQEVLGRAGHVLQIYEVPDVGDTKEREESDENIDPNKPKTLFVGTQSYIKTRHKKYAYWLRADFNEESEQKGFRRINPNTSILVKIHQILVDYVDTKQGTRKEREVSDCPGLVAFVKLITESGIEKRKERARSLVDLGITGKYWKTDKVLQGRNRVHYVFPLPLRDPS